MKNVNLKICGIVPGRTDSQIQHMADLLGFIFYDKSPRHVKPDVHKKIKALRGIKKVGVFVDESMNKILHLVEETGLSLVQLHGAESPEFCKSLRSKVQVIKTISVNAEEDLENVKRYKDAVDYYLFDTKGDFKGGNGIKFNWNLLKDRHFGRPFFLSGGISREDAQIIRDYAHPELAGIDINSCFETSPGTKDLELIEDFKKDLYNE